MNRRSFFGTVSATLGAALGAVPLSALVAAGKAGAAGATDPTPFNRDVVIARAQALASKPFAWPDPPLPDALKKLSYSQYQGIRFKEDRRLFIDPPTGFSVDLFHSGFIYNVPVEIFIVRDGMATKFPYNPDLFTFQLSKPPDPGTPLEFAGFRARTALNRPDVMDEFLVFAGASYFRAVAKGQVYGLSARGLAIGTAEKEGEEFPFFRGFWLEQPGDNRMVVHALLDGPSVAGAYRFTIRPGDVTLMDVEATLFMRKEIDHIGMAPLTSMFLYDAKDRAGHDDFRPAIHDSDGLAIWNGRDERIWRPLHNPRLLETSYFSDSGPRGFGLIQREKRFSEYEDLEAVYHKRPSLWIEPIGDWGKGSVVLIEIPTPDEIHDNIVAFWRPDQALAAGSESVFTYRMHWGWDAPSDPNRMRCVRTLSGAGHLAGARRFVIDFAPATGTPPPAQSLAPVITVSKGSIHNAIAMDNSEIGGVRISFELDPEGSDVVELRAELTKDGQPVSEVWIYRWTT